MNNSLTAVFAKDLDRLYKEIDSYESEESLWVISENISNSAGNLCLHILGNLNYFVGNKLGATGYIRKREKEFSSKCSKSELLDGVISTKEIVIKAIENQTPETLERDYPENVFGTIMKTDFFLIHLLGHLNYHLGQINYHRRILCYK